MFLPEDFEHETETERDEEDEGGEEEVEEEQSAPQTAIDKFDSERLGREECVTSHRKCMFRRPLGGHRGAVGSHQNYLGTNLLMFTSRLERYR